MRTNRLVIFAAMVLAACSADQRSISPGEPRFDKGVASPNATVNLKASYSTFVPTFYNDGRTVPGAPNIEYQASLGGERPTDIDHLNSCITHWDTLLVNTMMRVCLFRSTGDVSLWATCGRMFQGPPLAYPAVLTAFASMVPTVSYEKWTWVPPGQRYLTDSVREEVVLGDVPEPIFSRIFAPALQAIQYPYRPGTVNQIGFLPHDKTTTDIPHNAGMWDLALVPTTDPSLANHPACRGPDQEIPVVIPFSETANFVSTPSGNRNLIFNSSVGETALHYNANTSLITGTGSLQSDDGRYLIDLSQFTGSRLPIVDQIMMGPGARARACLVAAPDQCTDVILRQ